MQRYEVRKIYAWWFGTEWVEHFSCFYGHFTTHEEDMHKALICYLSSIGVHISKDSTQIHFEKYYYTLTDAQTKKPLFLAIICK